MLISVLSEYLVDSLEQTSADWGIPRLFIAVRAMACSCYPYG